jgi:thioredoxin reductase (NADPH)
MNRKGSMDGEGKERTPTRGAASGPNGTMPVILAVDDDAPVLAAVVRDLRAEYSDRFRVYGAASGAEALRILQDLRLHGRCVAMVLADQRMPGMTGIDLLRDAIRLFPHVKRVLLTAYADNEVAIRGINEIGLDHYLMKPWNPPEECLYPVLSDLLGEWQATHRPSAAEIRIIGHPWSADGHRVRDFLARNLVPFRWLDAEAGREATELLKVAEAREAKLPLVLFPDGSRMERPDSLVLARKIGLQTRARRTVYDLVIVGGGPAGLAAAVYASSEGLSTLIVERDAPGGQAGRSKSIENYLGFPVGLSGGDLARRAVAQARRFGTEILTPVGAVGVRSGDGYHALRLSEGSEVNARSLLIAAGVSYRLLDVPGAERLTGRGIYYGAAISEALAVQGRDVVVLGGGNSAGQAATYLSRYARSVTVVVRRPSLKSTMGRYLITQIEETPNIRIRTEADLSEVHGEDRLEAVALRDAGSGVAELLTTDALFVFIGATAQTDWLDGTVERDAQGFILSGPDLAPRRPRRSGTSFRRDPLRLETSVPGIFVAGDVRHRSIKGVAAAVGEGAMAMQLVRQYLGGGLLTPRPQVRVPAVIAAADVAAAPATVIGRGEP